jgi:ferredoxin-NADP reductase
MQTEKKVTESHLTTTGKNTIRLEKNAHFVFITGERGINDAFELIKSKLRNEPDSCLTLIYFYSAYLSQPLFKAELENLEKRFPSKLITHFLSCRNEHLPEYLESHQQILEIVINSNTFSTMLFMIQGNEEMINSFSDRLHFLGIKSNHIHSQII